MTATIQQLGSAEMTNLFSLQSEVNKFDNLYFNQPAPFSTKAIREDFEANGFIDEAPGFLVCSVKASGAAKAIASKSKKADELKKFLKKNFNCTWYKDRAILTTCCDKKTAWNLFNKVSSFFVINYTGYSQPQALMLLEEHPQ